MLGETKAKLRLGGCLVSMNSTMLEETVRWNIKVQSLFRVVIDNNDH